MSGKDRKDGNRAHSSDQCWTTTTRDFEEESNLVRAAVAGLTSARTRIVGTVTDRRNADGDKRLLANPTNVKVLVVRVTWVAIMGDVGRASTELVHLDT